MKISLSKDLGPAKRAAKLIVDGAAAEMRMLFITNIPGQSEVYRLKLEQAEKVIHGANCSREDIQMLIEESEAEGKTYREKALEIAAAAQRWQKASAMIEARRRFAKAKIDQATCPAEIEAAQEIDWGPVAALAEE